MREKKQDWVTKGDTFDSAFSGDWKILAWKNISKRILLWPPPIDISSLRMFSDR